MGFPRSSCQAARRWIAAALVLTTAGPAAPDPGLEARLAGHLQRLARPDSRLTGYPGADAAADYLEAQLRAQGVAEVHRRSFPVPVPVDEGAGLELLDSGEALPLHGMWPNLVRTSTLPPEGIAGALVYGGRAGPGELDGLELAGHIALLEYDCGMNWVAAFDLGAAAVIFLAPPDPGRSHRREGADKFLTTPADLPRFYAPDSTSQILRQRLGGPPLRARVWGRMDWRAMQAQTLVGLIPGTDPLLGREAVMIGAYYDASSPVPALAPGAEQAAGVAVWLELAAALARTPPRRSVLLVATAGHFQALAGMRDLVALLQRLQKGAPPESELEQRLRPLRLAYYLGLDLSSRTRQLSLVQAGDPYRVRTIQPPLYSALLRLAQEWEAGGALVLGGDLKPLNQRQLAGQLPERVPVEGAVVNLAGWLGLTLVSAGDERAAFGSPLDRPAHVEMEGLASQARFLLHLVPALLDDPEGGPQIPEPTDSFGTLRGQVVTWAGYAPDRPVAGAWVRVRSLHKTLMGVHMDPVALTDSAGRFVLEGLEARTLYLKPALLEAYRTDPESGAVVLALDQGPTAQQYPAEILMDHLDEELTLVGFPCRSLTLLELFDPRHLLTLEHLRLLDAAQEAPLVSYGFCLPPTPAEISRRGYYNTLGSHSEQTGVVFAPPAARVKLVMTTGRYGLGRRLLLLNSTPAQPQGRGFAVDSSPRLAHNAFAVARDLVLLNADRLGELERHGIHNPLLRRLHLRADTLLQRAGAALEAGEHTAFADLSQRAWGLALRTYGGIEGLLRDAVRGVVFFLLLLLPFAYLGERLCLGSSRISRQAAGAALLFLAGFLLLRFAHPAFQLGIHPLLILVGFLALVLSLVVAGMGLSRLNAQLRASLSPRLALHRADTRRGHILGRALLLGVAQMRRRPWRTGLTCATLSLLSFSLISLTSVSQALRINQLPLGQAGGGDAVLLRLPGWEGLERHAYECLDRRFGERAAARSWYLRPALLHGDQGRSARAEAVLGLMPQEQELTPLAQTLEAGRFFAPGERQVCILSGPQATELGIQPAQVGRATVRLLGADYTVIGFFSPQAFDRLTDLNGAPLTPLDREAQQPAEERLGHTRQGAEPAFAHLGSARLALLPWEVVERWGEWSRLASVAVHLKPAEAEAAVAELAELWGLDFFAALGGQRRLVSAVGVQSFSGQRGLWVPLLIGALIVFNTLLGSVYERLPEIGIFNAVGLAPLHVAGLFWAEAAVYAALSSSLGYLAGQLLSRIGWVWGLFPGLTVNYTSLSIAATLAGLGLVILASALYPAWQAARLCVPGIERRWKLPPARGELLEMPMPFALSRAETGGFTAFLSEYLEIYDEQSIGAGFYAESVQRAPQEVRARLWLAPFDQGLSQDFELLARPEGDGRFCALTLRLWRRSGDGHAWLRGNRLFIDELRRQFLVWRALAPAQRARYLCGQP